MAEFKECHECAKKPGSPVLCDQCLWVRKHFKQLKGVKISKETARRNIVEWLYANDGGYPNKLEWRKSFLEMIGWNFDHLK